jgi:hypothetical protein
LRCVSLHFLFALTTVMRLTAARSESATEYLIKKAPKKLKTN